MGRLAALIQRGEIIAGPLGFGVQELDLTRCLIHMRGPRQSSCRAGKSNRRHRASPIPASLPPGRRCATPGPLDHRARWASSARVSASTRQFGGFEAFLYPRLVGRGSTGQLGRISRAMIRRDGQAIPGQGNQRIVSSAGVEPGQGVDQVAARGTGADVLACRAGIRRAAREDLAEDRAQAEDVGRSSTRATSPQACSGAMYAGVPSTLPACDAPRPTAPHRHDHVSSSGSCQPWPRRRCRRAARPWPGPSPSPAPRRTSRPSRSTASSRGGSPRARGHRPSSGRPARRSPGMRGKSCAGSWRSAEHRRQGPPLTSFIAK